MSQPSSFHPNNSSSNACTQSSPVPALFGSPSRQLVKSNGDKSFHSNEQSETRGRQKGLFHFSEFLIYFSYYFFQKLLSHFSVFLKRIEILHFTIKKKWKLNISSFMRNFLLFFRPPDLNNADEVQSTMPSKDNHFQSQTLSG